MVSTAFQWISSNLSITGFTEGTAAFMSCKELVENAVDATSNLSDPAINLHIDESAELLQICSEDTGCGFMVDSVEALVNVFQSTRGSNDDGKCGKFGVGLKAMAYMSHNLSGGKQINIRSPLPGTQSSVSFSLGVTPSGEIEISEAQLGEAVECTSITIWTPRPENMEEFLRDIREYLNELTIFRVGIKITLSVNGEDEIFSHCSSGVPKSVKHRDPSGIVECIVTITQTVTRDSNSSKSASIIRFVNGVPLLASNTAGCCLLQTSAVTVSRSSTSMGLEFLDDSFSPFSIVRSSRNIRACSPHSTWHNLTVRVNLIYPSARVEYSSLIKEAVMGIGRQEGAPTLQVIVGRAVKGALRRMQNRFRSQFQSNEEYEHSRALRFYIPIIAKNLSEAAGRVNDKACKERLTDMFTLDVLNDQSQLESKLKTILVERLGSSTLLESRRA